MTDRTLIYHYPLCPFCRLVRLAYYEKGIPHALLTEIPWERRPAFLDKNPLGTLPMITEPDEYMLSGADTICTYLNEIHQLPDLMGETPRGRAEIHRLIEWTHSVFYSDVVKPILSERVYKTLQHKGVPDSNILRAARQNYKILMPYLDWIASRRSYLGGRHLSYADLAVAAQLSVLDYLGELGWEKLPDIKVWYAKIKSRSSFKSLLQDKVGGIMPTEEYTNLDF